MAMRQGAIGRIGGMAMRNGATGWKGACMKGQYFSFDAIVASVIFMLGMTLLLGQWFSVKQSTDLTNDYLQEDAFRASDILLSSGVPNDWHDPPSKLEGLSGVRKVGLGMSPSGSQALNQSLINDIEINWANPDLWDFGGIPTQFYNSFRTMLGVGSHIYIYIRSAETDPIPCWVGPPPYYCPVQSSYFGFVYGYGPNAMYATEFVHVRRIVAFEDKAHAGRMMPGAMDLYIYKNTSIR